MDLKEVIFRHCNREFKLFPRKLFGENLGVLKLSGNDLDRLDELRTKRSDDGKLIPNIENARGKFVYLVLCDDTGKRIFDEKDIPQIGELPGHILEYIIDFGTEYNSIGQEDERIAELKKS